ncbi:MAG TPA: DedA family protein [Candidatus Binataceae bacterium]|nr:DedA family protein [Candidatus Binataceae bacterium]
MEYLRHIALALGFWIYPVVGIELFLESSAFLGIVLPGDSVVILMGILCGAQITSLWIAVPLLVGCTFSGDVSAYLLGRYKGEALLAKSQWARRHYEKRHDQVVRYARRWGIWIIVIGRFLPFLRALTPFTMGTTGMRLWRLLPAAAVASIVWCGGWFALGYVFSSQWQEIEPILKPAGSGIIAAIVVGLVGWVCWRYREKIKMQVQVLRHRMHV